MLSLCLAAACPFSSPGQVGAKPHLLVTGLLPTLPPAIHVGATSSPPLLPSPLLLQAAPPPGIPRGPLPAPRLLSPKAASFTQVHLPAAAVSLAWVLPQFIPGCPLAHHLSSQTPLSASLMLSPSPRPTSLLPQKQ